MTKKKLKVSQTMQFDRKNRTVIPNTSDTMLPQDNAAAAAVLAQGHPKSGAVTQVATPPTTVTTTGAESHTD